MEHFFQAYCVLQPFTHVVEFSQKLYEIGAVAPHFEWEYCITTLRYIRNPQEYVRVRSKSPLCKTRCYSASGLFYTTSWRWTHNRSVSTAGQDTNQQRTKNTEGCPAPRLQHALGPWITQCLARAGVMQSVPADWLNGRLNMHASLYKNWDYDQLHKYSWAAMDLPEQKKLKYWYSELVPCPYFLKMDSDLTNQIVHMT